LRPLSPELSLGEERVESYRGPGAKATTFRTDPLVQDQIAEEEDSLSSEFAMRSLWPAIYLHDCINLYCETVISTNVEIRIGTQQTLKTGFVDDRKKTN